MAPPVGASAAAGGCQHAPQAKPDLITQQAPRGRPESAGNWRLQGSLRLPASFAQRLRSDLGNHEPDDPAGCASTRRIGRDLAIAGIVKGVRRPLLIGCGANAVITRPLGSTSDRASQAVPCGARGAINHTAAAATGAGQRATADFAEGCQPPATAAGALPRASRPVGGDPPPTTTTMERRGIPSCSRGIGRSGARAVGSDDCRPCRPLAPGSIRSRLSSRFGPSLGRSESGFCPGLDKD
jgi:hypothetical protein